MDEIKNFKKPEEGEVAEEIFMLGGGKRFTSKCKKGTEGQDKETKQG